MVENDNQIGYSQKIKDPAFAKYVKDTNRWSGCFSLGLAFFAVLGFYIYGETSSEMDNPEAVYIGLVIGSMFMLIALFQIVSKNKSSTWDGIIVDKKISHKRRHDKNQNRWLDYLEYSVCIQDENLKMHYSVAADDDTIYNYYKIGDKVRHHKGLNSYEKQDKSLDSIIFCNACATLNDINDEFCFRCKCPLLK